LITVNRIFLVLFLHGKAIGNIVHTSYLNIDVR